MKVLHVANGYLFGGIERMLVTLAEHRAITPAMQPMFAVACPGRLADELEDSGVPVMALGHVRLRRPDTIVRSRAMLGDIIARRRPDAVVCHAPWSYAVFAGVARRLHVPVIWWQHDRASGRPLVERWARRIPADLVISNSRWSARTAAAIQPRARLDVIYCPVAFKEPPATARTDMRAAFGATNAHVVLLAASRLEPWKGHDHLLRALHRLAANPSWVLWIAGGAQRPHEVKYLARLERTIDALGLTPRIRFLGDRRDIPALMAASDLLVQANEGPEPFGIVFAEALLAGLPVVTTDMGGAPEIVDNTCGRLVTPDDVPGLADCLAELIADSRLRARLGAAGRAHAMIRCAPQAILPRLQRTLAAHRLTAAA